MRKILKVLSLLICTMLLFSACAGSLNLRPGPFRSEMQDVFVQQTTLTVPASHAEHGEDYVIEWQDPVMEQHVRKWLDRPKGDIYHSDVWDYQRVTINSGTGIEDLIVKDAPDGVDIGGNVSSNEQLAACAVSVKGTYDPVTSLADLRHFDSLQVLYISNKMGASPITDLTGLEECKNLMLLSVPSVESSAFPTFAKLDSVVELKYGSGGIRTDSNVSDLSALAQMKSLKMLWITGSEVDLTQLAGADLRVLRLDVTRIGSLEALKQMENLSLLQLNNGQEIDSFAPLAGSSVQYLSMSLSEAEKENYKDMDYTPLTQMPQLIWLDLTNNITFDTETCKRLGFGKLLFQVGQHLVLQVLDFSCPVLHLNHQTSHMTELRYINIPCGLGWHMTSAPTISYEQYLQLEDFLKKKDNPALLPIQIAYYTGLRIGEVCGLTWQDINLEG